MCSTQWHSWVWREAETAGKPLLSNAIVEVLLRSLVPARWASFTFSGACSAPRLCASLAAPSQVSAGVRAAILPDTALSPGHAGRAQCNAQPSQRVQPCWSKKAQAVCRLRMACCDTCRPLLRKRSHGCACKRSARSAAAPRKSTCQVWRHARSICLSASGVSIEQTICASLTGCEATERIWTHRRHTSCEQWLCARRPWRDWPRLPAECQRLPKESRNIDACRLVASEYWQNLDNLGANLKLEGQTSSVLSRSTALQQLRSAT